MFSTNPDPDLESKPKDLVGYCFGYACLNHHVDFTFDSLSVEGFSTRKVCQKCGEISKPCTAKRSAEAIWIQDVYPFMDFSKPPQYYWTQTDNRFNIFWNKFDFIKFLED